MDPQVAMPGIIYYTEEVVRKYAPYMPTPYPSPAIRPQLVAMICSLAFMPLTYVVQRIDPSLEDNSLETTVK